MENEKITMTFKTSTCIICVLLLLFIAKTSSQTKENMRCKRGGYRIVVPEGETVELTIDTKKWSTTQVRCVVNVAGKHGSSESIAAHVTWKILKYKIEKQCQNRACKCQPYLFIADDAPFGLSAAIETTRSCYDPGSTDPFGPFKGVKAEEIQEVGESGKNKQIGPQALIIFVQQFDKNNHLYAVITLTTEVGDQTKFMKTAYIVAAVVSVLVILIVIVVVVVVIKTQKRRRAAPRQCGVILNAPPGVGGVPPPPSGQQPITQGMPPQFAHPGQAPPHANQPAFGYPPGQQPSAPGYPSGQGPPGQGYPPGQGPPGPGHKPAHGPPGPDYSPGPPPPPPQYPPSDQQYGQPQQF